MRKLILKGLGIALVLIVLAAAVYQLPPVHSRLAWRLATLLTRAQYVIRPPDRQGLGIEVESQPVYQSTIAALVKLQLTATAAVTPTPAQPTSTPAPADPLMTATPVPPTSTPVPTSTPLAAKVMLAGFRYEYQTFNNCGPTNLSMLLSYWKWKGDQRTTKAALRPNDDDANVMPEEMVQFVEKNTRLKAVLAYGGDLESIKRLIAAGFPVLIETGHQPAKDWWMGHYVLVSGYDDAKGILMTQDSLIMPNLPVPYKDLEAHWWRDFNYVYLVAYPPEKLDQVKAILQDDMLPDKNRVKALAKANGETLALAGRDQFFALYNQGDNLLAQGFADQAAQSYDAAIGMYKQIEEKQRPWRVFWYRTGPYQAYYQTGRYQDVINLANSVLSMLSKRGLEESHYWRGMGYEALGQTKDALDDYKIALTLHPGYIPAQEGLKRLGGN